MIHYLRLNNNTVVDVEATKDDIRSIVCIAEYSRLLLKCASQDGVYSDAIVEMMLDFEGMQGLRGEYHETTDKKESPDEFVRRRLRKVGKKYGLTYVTD